MSITLAAAQVTTSTLGGATIETNAQAAVVPLRVDFFGNRMDVQLLNGTTSGSNFTPGTSSPKTITISLDLVSGQWTTNNGLSGTLSGVSLTSLLNSLKSLRNSVEVFSVNNNIVGPGATQVPW